MGKRSFEDFLKLEGNAGVRRIAIEYSRYDDSITIGTLAKSTNMHQNGIKKLLKYAIINLIVPYSTALDMKNKAHRNQARHSDTRVKTSSDLYYEKIFEERLVTIKNLPDSKIKEIVDFYLEYPDLSAKQIANSLGFSRRELNVALKKAIVQNIVDDLIVEKLSETSLSKTDEVREKMVISMIFHQYTELRALYKSLNSKIAQLHFQIEAYEGFVSGDEELEQPLKELEKELEKTYLKLRELKNSF